MPIGMYWSSRLWSPVSTGYRAANASSTSPNREPVQLAQPTTWSTDPLGSSDFGTDNSDLPLAAVAEQSRRPHHQDHQEDAQGNGVAEGRVDPEEQLGLDHAEHDPADQGAELVADPADGDGDEAVQGQVGPRVEHRRGHRDGHHATEARDDAGHQERDRPH